MRKRTRKRTCYDRLRMRVYTARRASGANPAASVAAQLLAIFTAIFGRLPIPVPPTAPPKSSGSSFERSDMANRLSIHKRYLDTFLNHGTVPYSVLFAHIRQGGPVRRDAFAELRKKAPEASLDWLNHVERNELWSDLTRCFVRDGSETDTDVKLLKSTLAWTEASKPETNVGPTETGTDVASGVGVANDFGSKVCGPTSRKP